MHYALTAQGQKVPILDYTLDEFRHEPPTAIQNLGSLAMLRGLKWMPDFGRHLLSQRSDVLKNLLVRDSDGFFSGPATYLAKLGPRAPHLSRLDHLASASVQSIESARRGYSIALLESELLAGSLRGGNALRTVDFLNIGGGPANDNLNALLLLRKNHPKLFKKLIDENVPISIHVLDSDSDGAVLGKNSLAVLRAKGNPLEGARAKLKRIPYDWADPDSLASLLRGVKGRALISAEGSLFEYGSDKHVLQNLRALRKRTRKATPIVGSAFKKPGEISLIARRMSRLSPQLGWKFRGIKRIRSLASRAGWSVGRVDSDNSIYVTFILRAD